MKKVFGWVLALLLLTSLTSVALANEARIFDGADLLDDQEESLLQAQIDAIRTEFAFDVVLVTTEDSEGKAARDYAADYYDYGGFGMGSAHDGLIAAICMDTRDFIGVGTGYGMTVFPGDVLTDMYESVVDDLSDGAYYETLRRYLASTAQRLEYPNGGMSWNDAIAKTVRLSPFLLVGTLLIGLIVVSIMKSGMRTSKRKFGARDYVRDGSFQLKASQDLYLYSTTTRTKIESSSSSGGGNFTGSSGTSHSSGGGKF